MNRKVLVCLVVVLGLPARALPARAHHAFSAVFDEKKPIKMTGTVTKLEWQNPHTWFYIEVKDASGKVTNIAADVKPEMAQLQPWAAALFKERLASEGKADPMAHCKPTGVPAINSIPLPYKIIQT